MSHALPVVEHEALVRHGLGVCCLRRKGFYISIIEISDMRTSTYLLRCRGYATHSGVGGLEKYSVEYLLISKCSVTSLVTVELSVGYIVRTVNRSGDRRG